jgi:hypothetical protein
MEKDRMTGNSFNYFQDFLTFNHAVSAKPSSIIFIIEIGMI